MMHDPDQLSERYPQAWASIHQQVEQVSRETNGASFVFLGAEEFGAELRATFACDLDVATNYGNQSIFTAPIGSKH